MPRRVGTNNLSGESRQLGGRDRRGRRNAQISSVHKKPSNTIREVRGRTEVVVGRTLKSTSEGLDIVPASAVSDAVGTDPGDIATTLNSLLAALRLAGILEP